MDAKVKPEGRFSVTGDRGGGGPSQVGVRYRHRVGSVRLPLCEAAAVGFGDAQGRLGVRARNRGETQRRCEANWQQVI